MIHGIRTPANSIDDYVSNPVTLEEQAADDATQSINTRFLDACLAMQEGSTLLDRVIGVYLDEAPVAIRNMQTAVRNGDVEALCRAAHKCKSSNMQLGAERMTAMCAQLDRLGRLGVTTGTQAILAEMQYELTSVKILLQSYRSSQGTVIAEPE